MHSFSILDSTTEDVTFECLLCQVIITVKKEGFGEPCTQVVEGIHVPPINIDSYLDPCIGE